MILTCRRSPRCHRSCRRPPGNRQDMLCRPPSQSPGSAGGSFGLIAHVCASSRSAHPDTPQGIQETESPSAGQSALRHTLFLKDAEMMIIVSRDIRTHTLTRMQTHC